MTCIGPSSGMRVRHGQFPTRPQGSPASAFQGEMRSKPMSHRKNDGGGGTLQTVAHTPRPTLPPAVTPTQTDAATDSLPHTHTHACSHRKPSREREKPPADSHGSRYTQKHSSIQARATRELSSRTKDIAQRFPRYAEGAEAPRDGFLWQRGAQGCRTRNLAEIRLGGDPAVPAPL